MQDPTKPSPADIPGSAVQAIADLARRGAMPGIAVASIAKATPFVILRDEKGGERVEWLQVSFEAPHHIDGTQQFDDVPSFLAYWDRFATPDSLMYASMEPAQFVGVLNEHTGGATRKPGWRDHRCAVTLRHSPEWLAWMKRNGSDKGFESPMDFAQWLEDMLPDVISPPAASLQEVLLTMRLNETVQYTHAGLLQNGQIKFVFNHIIEGSATTKDAGEVSIPERFKLNIPVFAGMDAPRYQVDARLRYRRASSTLRVWYELERPHKVVETAFRDLHNMVKVQCGEVMLGKP